MEQTKKIKKRQEEMIITDKNKITQVCEPCTSVDEGAEIGAQLLTELGDKGIGLSANQIGSPFIVIAAENFNDSKSSILIPSTNEFSLRGIIASELATGCS